MQLTKMATGMTPGKRKKALPLSCVMDMLENSPSKRPRLSDPDRTREKTPETKLKVDKPIRRTLISASPEDKDKPAFEVRSFYSRNPVSSIQQKDGILHKKESPTIETRVARSYGPKPTRKRPKRWLTERTSSNIQKKKKRKPDVKRKPSKQLIKDVLTFTIDTKSASPRIVNAKQYPSPVDAEDFGDRLMWDVEKPANKIFKGRSNEDQPQEEKSTKLVVRQGFNLKFIHHRGDSPKNSSADKGRKLKFPMTHAQVSRKYSDTKTPTAKFPDEEEDLMMRKLREELKEEPEADDAFGFSSFCEESLPALSKKKRVGTTRDPDFEMSPELFSQSPMPMATSLDRLNRKADLCSVSHNQGDKVEESKIKDELDRVMSPLVDSACFTGQTNFQDETESGRSSPSVSSESSCYCPPSESCESSPSSTSQKTRTSFRGKLKEAEKDGQKYFPIFTQSPAPKRTQIFKSGDSAGRRSASNHRGSATMSKTSRLKALAGNRIIDAGQSKIGAIQCDICCMIYTPGDYDDEATHAKYHRHLLTTIKFPGWKGERVLQAYDEDCGRVLMVLPDDPKYATKKVEDINEIMAQELGFSAASISSNPANKVFLYVSNDTVVGCCVAEPVSQGYRIILDSTPASLTSHRPWCSELTPSPAAVGVSRIWVYGQNRRKGVATKLLECVRHWFEYGVVISKDMVAFSDPTPDGKELGAHYSGRPDFLVYKYIHDTV